MKIIYAAGTKFFQFMFLLIIFKCNKVNYSESDNINPVNKYALSKLGGECSVQFHPKSLIVRTSFCGNTYMYDKASTDQYTSRITVGEFVVKLKKVIEDDTILGIINIGERRISVYNLAKSLSDREIIPIVRSDIKNYKLPGDTSLDTLKYKMLCG